MSITNQDTAYGFTKTELDIAKETDLPDLLSHLGYQVRRLGNYYTTKEMDSIRIKDRRSWKRYSTGQGGDAITFLQEFCDKDFREAVNYLLEFNGGRARDSPLREPSREETPKEKAPFVLPTPNWDQRRVFAYLQKRCIAPQVIQDFIQAGLLYEDAYYHNCVFVGKDGGGQPRFASKRGTYDLDGSSFKRDVAGSDKNIAFPLPCDPVLDWVAVFEAPIDLMSFCTLHRQVRSNAIALCGLYEGGLDTYLKDNPHLKRIILCLDADIPGYPISVEEYTAGDFDELRIEKVYQLSLDDDPSGIPTEDFIRGDRLYYLLDMTRKDEVGVDTQSYTQTVTLPSDTNNLETILQLLDAEMEVTTEDGYTGTLHLDHTTVQVTTDGYATKTGTVSATRTYPNLSEADLSLIPKTIEDKGRTLNLADVQWNDSLQTETETVVQRYTATAKYTGTTSSKYATGYTVSADYTGEVAKTGCNVVTYTAVFGSMEAPKGTANPSENDPSSGISFDFAAVKRPLMIGGLVVVLAVGGVFVFKKLRGRR